MPRRGPADYRVMPWKNGLGSTTELLIHPPGSTLEGGFLWRISMADVGASGPFSPFPGVDRTLLLLDGAMELDHGPHGLQRLEAPFQPVSFSGDWTTRGRLLGGPCRDFNVLSARGRVRHRVEVLRPGPDPLELPGWPTLVLFCARGAARVGDEGLEALELMERQGGATLRAERDGTVVVAVGFEPEGD